VRELLRFQRLLVRRFAENSCFPGHQARARRPSGAVDAGRIRPGRAGTPHPRRPRRGRDRPPSQHDDRRGRRPHRRVPVGRRQARRARRPRARHLPPRVSRSGFHETDPDDGVALLRSGGLDVLVAYDYDLLTPVPSGGLESIHLLDDPVLATVPPTHRLATVAALDLAELADERWVAGLPTTPSAHWSTAPAGPPASNHPSPTGPRVRHPGGPRRRRTGSRPPTRARPHQPHRRPLRPAPLAHRRPTRPRPPAQRIPPPTSGRRHHRPADRHRTPDPITTPTDHGHSLNPARPRLRDGLLGSSLRRSASSPTGRLSR
jgi:hypothetical protein